MRDIVTAAEMKGLDSNTIQQAGIPSLVLMERAALKTADEITEITGILNGTTNYMLTKMDTEGADYDAVLKEAQDKGYAERHPEADVEGYDACRKIAILTSLAYGMQVDYVQVLRKMFFIGLQAQVFGLLIRFINMILTLNLVL